ncbi:antitoxin [Streptomyces sp. XD-27]|uniref:antitoxin n=1 Tax=Streptomyces sp. XD-27 TaxID=3062779 RepID=UPI0026F4630F|nr:antitoxin [Streptomyces sp. XD-27]WKX72967.1 antitoxin [Streptomyces sp. XD-27]
MGLLDTLKAKADRVKGKAGDFVHQHEDKIERGLDKAAKTVDTKTKGKYSDRIGTGTGKAKEALGRIAHKDTGAPGAGASDTGTPGTPPGAAPEAGKDREPGT